MATFKIKHTEIDELQADEFIRLARYAALYSPRAITEQLAASRYAFHAAHAAKGKQPKIKDFIPDINKVVTKQVKRQETLEEYVKRIHNDHRRAIATTSKRNS